MVLSFEGSLFGSRLLLTMQPQAPTLAGDNWTKIIGRLVMGRPLVAILFALIAFFIAWPAVTAWQIYGVFQDTNLNVLSSRVDFPSEIGSTRLAVEARIQSRIEQL